MYLLMYTNTDFNIVKIILTIIILHDINIICGTKIHIESGYSYHNKNKHLYSTQITFH